MRDEGESVTYYELSFEEKDKMSLEISSISLCSIESW